MIGIYTSWVVAAVLGGVAAYCSPHNRDLRISTWALPRRLVVILFVFNAAGAVAWESLWLSANFDFALHFAVLCAFNILCFAIGACFLQLPIRMLDAVVTGVARGGRFLRT
ncbi:MAG: hypothetical protein WA021_04540 [Minisyncoccia bacterium]